MPFFDSKTAFQLCNISKINNQCLPCAPPKTFVNRFPNPAKTTMLKSFTVDQTCQCVRVLLVHPCELETTLPIKINIKIITNSSLSRIRHKEVTKITTVTTTITTTAVVTEQWTVQVDKILNKHAKWLCLLVQIKILSNWHRKNFLQLVKN